MLHVNIYNYRAQTVKDSPGPEKRRRRVLRGRRRRRRENTNHKTRSEQTNRSYKIHPPSALVILVCLKMKSCLPLKLQTPIIPNNQGGAIPKYWSILSGGWYVSIINQGAEGVTVLGMVMWLKTEISRQTWVDWYKIGFKHSSFRDN